MLARRAGECRMTSVERVACESEASSVRGVGLASRTDGRTDGLTKNLLTDRTSGTFRNAHTRVADSDSAEMGSEPGRDPERLLAAAYDAMRTLGREVRALRERLAGEES